MPSRRRKRSNHLKHWFVPHKHNDHRPHLIRRHGLALIAGVIVALQLAASLIMPHQGGVLAYASGSITVNDLLTQTNQQRAANGLPPLRLNTKLSQSAGLKSSNMFVENYWAHVSRSCLQPWHWFELAGYSYGYAGENLAQGFDTTSGVIAGWMNSPGHRANILNSNYTEVGFFVKNGVLTRDITPDCSQAPQERDETTLVVAHYGAPFGSSGTSVNATVAPAATPSPAPTPVVLGVPQAQTPTPIPAPVTTASPGPTPTASPTPEPSPTPTASPVAAPVSQGKVEPGAPAPVSYSLFRPLSLVRTLSWNTLATIMLLIILLGVYVITHVTVWRKGLNRWRRTHYRWLAGVQVGGLSTAIMMLAVSGFGKVG